MTGPYSKRATELGKRLCESISKKCAISKEKQLQQNQ